MENKIIIGVFRRLDNRFDGLDDNSDQALDLHNLRKKALNDVFDKKSTIQVIDWGNTNDTIPHEYVELILTTITSSIILPFIIKGIKELGKKLVEKAIDETTSELVKWVITKLIKKQKEQKILDFNIKLKDGTLITVDPPQGKSEIRVNFKNGELTSIKYEFDNS